MENEKQPTVASPIEPVVSSEFDHVFEGEYEEITDLDRYLLKAAMKGSIRSGFMVEAVAMRTIKGNSR